MFGRLFFTSLIGLFAITVAYFVGYSSMSYQMQVDTGTPLWFAWLFVIVIVLAMLLFRRH